MLPWVAYLQQLGSILIQGQRGLLDQLSQLHKVRLNDFVVGGIVPQRFLWGEGQTGGKGRVHVGLC